MKNKDVKVKNNGMEKTLVKYASDISGAVVSILNALTVVENCCAEIEKNRIICQNQSMMIDNEILKITTKYAELNKNIENEINEIEHSRQIKLDIKHKIIETIEQLGRQADSMFMSIVTNDDYCVEDWLYIMDKIKALRCCI